MTRYDELIRRARELAKMLDLLESREWRYGGCEDESSDSPYDREGYVYGPKYLELPDTMAMEPVEARFVAAAPEMAKLLGEMAEALEHAMRTIEQMRRAADDT